MDITRHSLFERQLALIQYYLARLDDIHHIYSQGHEWAQEALRSFGLELYAQEPENPFGWSGALAGLSHAEARRAIMLSRSSGLKPLQAS